MSHMSHPRILIWRPSGWAASRYPFVPLLVTVAVWRHSPLLYTIKSPTLIFWYAFLILDFAMVLISQTIHHSECEEAQRDNREAGDHSGSAPRDSGAMWANSGELPGGCTGAMCAPPLRPRTRLLTTALRTIASVGQSRVDHLIQNNPKMRILGFYQLDLGLRR